MLKSYRPIAVHTLAYHGPLVHVVEGAIATETVHVTKTDYFGTATVTDTYVPFGSSFHHTMDRIDMVSGIVPFKPSAIHPPMNPLAHPPPHPFPHPPPFKATKPTWSPELGGRPSFVPSPVTNVPSPSKTLLPVMETPVSTVLSMSHTSVVSDIISVIGNAPDLAVKSLLRPFNMALASALQEFPRIFKGIIETEYADIASKSFAAISSKGVPTWASSK